MNDLFRVNEFALEWFRANLQEGGHPLANEYVTKRRITSQSSERFQLGFAPDSWTALIDSATAQGYDIDVLVEARLAVKDRQSGVLFDRYRNRVVFPIWDPKGSVVGFAGRLLKKDSLAPKYLIPAESPVCQKSESLYGINLANKAIAESGYAILTEGFTDTLMAHQHGLEMTVATLGTCVTKERASLLRQYTSKVFLLFDGDEAGCNAASRAKPVLREAGLDVRVVSLLSSEDPDSFLRRFGVNILKLFMELSD